MPSILSKEKPLRQVSNAEEEDQEPLKDYCFGGYLPVKLGDTFRRKRYKVIQKLGWGAFSTVWLCSDRSTKDFVAIKIMKGRDSDLLNGFEEIRILKRIGRPAIAHRFMNRFVNYYDYFTVNSVNGIHCCLIFEVLGDSLYKFQGNYFKNGIPLQLVKHILRQILEGLSYLHKKCGLIHTDIKPENILLTIDRKRIGGMHSKVEQLIGIGGESQIPNFEKPFEGFQQKDIQKFNHSLERLGADETQLLVKIADLGNAKSVNDYNNHTIQTRPYRSPEVILGSAFNASADIYSVGCMAFELSTGHVLFDHGNSNYRSRNDIQLSQILVVLGPLPKSCRKGRHYKKYFSRTGRLLAYNVITRRTLDSILTEEHFWDTTVANDFAQLLLPMLAIDPRKRATASQCLSNQWFSI